MQILGTQLPGLRELDLGVLSVCGVDDGGAADLCDSLPVAVKAPAANLVRTDHILDELEEKINPRF